MVWQRLYWVLSSAVAFVLLWSSSSFAKESGITFKKARIQIQDQVLEIDVAETHEQQARGLMFVKKIPQNYGMLFVYQDEQHRGFWMKNTLIPLSIGFFDAQMKLLEVLDMRPVKTFLDTDIDTVTSKQPAKYALEVNQGWFKKNKIKVGSKFKWLEKPKDKEQAAK